MNSNEQRDYIDQMLQEADVLLHILGFIAVLAFTLYGNSSQLRRG